MTQITPPSPVDLGFDRRFEEWRGEQLQAIQDALESDKRFIVQVLGTGEGKSLSVVAQAVLSHARVCILTSSKGLQTQYLEHFGEENGKFPGIVDIRGKNNYHCDGLPGKMCSEGDLGRCRYSGANLCNYETARQRALDSSYVITNYSYWIHSNKRGQGLGVFDMLVLDEAHNALEALQSAMRIQLTEEDVGQTLKFEWPDTLNDLKVWKEWALVAGSKTGVEVETLRAKIKAMAMPSDFHVKRLRKFIGIQQTLSGISTCHPDKWTVDIAQDGFEFNPIHASDYAEKLLFRRIPRVLLTSGTIRPKTIKDFGIDLENDVDFFEYHGERRLGRSPLIYIPTAKIDRNSTDKEYKTLVKRIDEIFEEWAEWRGIIHTANRDLRNYIMDRSAFAKYMISNYAGDITADIVAEYKKIEPPIALVSYSVSTGYDFPDDSCRWQIIAKVPFPNNQSNIDKERDRLDPQRGAYKAMQLISQAWGRPVRSKDDWAYTFILDDNVEWFLKRYEKLSSPWMLANYRKMGRVPGTSEVAV